MHRDWSVPNSVYKDFASDGGLRQGSRCCLAMVSIVDGEHH